VADVVNAGSKLCLRLFELGKGGREMSEFLQTSALRHEKETDKPRRAVS